jgi:hypothetical protein
MPPLPITEINAIVERLNIASTTFEKGKAFEDLFCEILNQYLELKLLEEMF